MSLSFPCLPCPTQPSPTQLENRDRAFVCKALSGLAWHEISRVRPWVTVVGGNSTTATTARGTVVDNLVGSGPGLQKHVN